MMGNGVKHVLIKKGVKMNRYDFKIMIGDVVRHHTIEEDILVIYKHINKKWFKELIEQGYNIEFKIQQIKNG